MALGIGDNFFQPAEITIQAGKTFRIKIWNQGQNTHDVWMAGPNNQSGTGDDIRSKPIGGGDSASLKVRFDKPGVYNFVCTFHAGQGGRLVVE